MLEASLDDSTMNEPLWKKRGPVEERCIADKFSDIVCRNYHYPRNGRPIYKIGSRSSDEIVRTALTLSNDGCLLEIGSADGSFLNRAVSQLAVPASRIKGISAHDLRTAPVDAEYIVGNAETYPWNDEHFCLIISSHTWGFFADPFGSLARYFDLLEISGQLYADSFDFSISSLQTLCQWISSMRVAKAELIVQNELFDHKWLVITKLAPRPLTLPFVYAGYSPIGYEILADFRGSFPGRIFDERNSPCC